MNILLVEPDYKRRCVPLGLMKISTYHKNLGDTIEYVRGTPLVMDGMYNGKKISKIYITSLFTWQADIVAETANYYQKMFPDAEVSIGGICATVLDELIKKKTGIAPHKGVIPEVEKCKPDYSLFPDINYSIGYTTRGCPNRCGFCLVPKLEPEFVELSDWYKMLNLSKDKIIFWDNNFLAASKEHFTSVMMRLVKYKKLVDFNQGLDARIFNEYHAKFFSKIRIHPLRFAFDGKQEDGYIQNAINLARDYNINDISVYVLFNFIDTPADFYYRLKELNKLSVNIFPMKYAPPTYDGRTHIGKHWSDESLRGFRNLMGNFIAGMVGQGCKPDRFNEVFGNNEDEFTRRLLGEKVIVQNDSNTGQKSMFDF